MTRSPFNHWARRNYGGQIPGATMTDPAQQERYLRELRRDALGIHRFGLLRDPAGVIPYVGVGMERRPDVQDLLRMMEQEHCGDSALTWAIALRPDGGGEARLEVEYRTPVRCTFGVLFRLPEHLDVLTPAAITDRLALASAEPPEDNVEQALLVDGLPDGIRISLLFYLEIAEIAGWDLEKADN